jgi:FkbM family methyltransferase
VIQAADEVVRAAYNLLLSREPEPVGLRHWASALQNGLSRVEFVRAMLASAEFRQTMAAIEDLTPYQDVDLIIPIRGQQFRVPASDISLVPILLKYRCWEPHITRYLTREIRPSHVFVDVGANVGYFTVLCAPLADRVVAFEPVARTCGYCRTNVELNKLTNVELRQQALWHEETTLQINLDSSSVMTAAVVTNGSAATFETISAVSLDGLIATGRLDLPRLDILKMDAEGAELSALIGMHETLARCRPRIVMEINRATLALLGASVDEVWDCLSDLSYEIRAFEPWKEQDPVPVASLDDLKRLCPPDSLIDIVAIQRSD